MNKNTKMTFYRSISNEIRSRKATCVLFLKKQTLTENILFIRNLINE